MAEGLTNRQIAAELIISERTAARHVEHILHKLGFASRAQVAAWAGRREEKVGDRFGLHVGLHHGSKRSAARQGDARSSVRRGAG